MAKSAERPQPGPLVQVTLNGEAVPVPKGMVVGDLLKERGLSMPCAGMGRCGKCRVRATGALGEPTAAEREKLSPQELEEHLRLACQTVILGPCQVEWEQAAGMAVQLGGKAALGKVPLFSQLGVALDFGTTTLAAQLYGRKGLLAQAGCGNPQEPYGADVISRIQRALAGEGEALQKAVCQGISQLVCSLAEQAGVPVEQIDTVVITGNTSMLYLLTGRDPQCLSHAPFQADWLAGDSLPAAALGLPCPEAQVVFPPCVSAFVGADITCAMLQAGLGESPQPELLVDIGTNGEIALSAGGKLLCCSTAAGPAFEAVERVNQKLLDHYGFSSYDQLLEKFQIDVVPVVPRYIGPPLPTWKNEKGETVEKSYWGFETTMHVTDIDTYGMTSYFPLNGVESIEDVKERYTFPDPDWFDYDSLKEQCEKYPDKALIMGHEGPFQFVTFLMEMDQFFMLMLDEPETAHYILDKMVEFELEYYRRCFEAVPGRIDILRPHDDYGTQISLLFSVDMWREFFQENTKKLVDLAHQHGAFYQQHSCGAVGPLIPEFIACCVDVLEPIQKVQGLEVDGLQEKFGGKITFHGGIDTQSILPYGTAEEVGQETRKFIDTLSASNGGYILMASQAFEGDVPVANIEALYSADRRVNPQG